MVVSWGGVLFENSIVCFFGFEQIVFVWKCDTNYFIYFLIDDRLWFQLCQRGSCTPRVRFVLVFEIGLSGFLFCNGEFDPGSGRTLAACLTHASRTMKRCLHRGLVANG